ncbi:MAG: RNHCP domain-containing protein [Parcubacteria group bacterium]|jgi:rubrerythrin
MQSKKFQRKKEDFICAICGAAICGDGYTDHCPNCLWGKHVDINPGDRKAKCGGRMRPVKIEEKSGKILILYICEKCGHKYRVKKAEEDDMDKIIEIMSNVATL